MYGESVAVHYIEIPRFRAQFVEVAQSERFWGQLNMPKMVKIRKAHSRG